ncbi:hypothetical protein ES702_00693 [subsurface metagenome]
MNYNGVVLFGCLITIGFIFLVWYEHSKDLDVKKND